MASSAKKAPKKKSTPYSGQGKGKGSSAAGKFKPKSPTWKTPNSNSGEDKADKKPFNKNAAGKLAGQKRKADAKASKNESSEVDKTKLRRVNRIVKRPHADLVSENISFDLV